MEMSTKAQKLFEDALRALVGDGELHNRLKGAATCLRQLDESEIPEDLRGRFKELNLPDWHERCKRRCGAGSVCNIGASRASRDFSPALPNELPYKRSKPAIDPSERQTRFHFGQHMSRGTFACNYTWWLRPPIRHQSCLCICLR